MTDKEALELLETTLKIYKVMIDDINGLLFVEAFERAVNALKEKVESEE